MIKHKQTKMDSQIKTNIQFLYTHTHTHVYTLYKSIITILFI